MAIRFPGSQPRPASTPATENIIPIEEVITVHLDRLQELDQKDDLVEIDLNQHLLDLRNPQIKPDQRKHILADIFETYLFILRNTRNRLDLADRNFLQGLEPLLRTQAERAGVDIKAIEQSINQAVEQHVEKLAEGNSLIITDDKLRKLLMAPDGRVTIERVSKDSITLRTGDFKSVTLPRAKIEGHYEFDDYGRVERETQLEQWPVPEPGKEASIMVNGDHVGSITTDPSGQRYVVKNFTTGETQVIRGDKATVIAEMKEEFTPKN